jgi:predicted secreted protein
MESRVKKILVFAMMVVASTVGSAAQADETTKAGDTKPAAEKKICRTEQVTGSLARRHRICLTQAEWDKVAADTQKNVSEFQRNQSRTPQTASGPFGN